MSSMTVHRRKIPYSLVPRSLISRFLFRCSPIARDARRRISLLSAFHSRLAARCDNPPSSTRVYHDLFWDCGTWLEHRPLMKPGPMNYSTPFSFTMGNVNYAISLAGERHPDDPLGRHMALTANITGMRDDEIRRYSDAVRSRRVYEE